MLRLVEAHFTSAGQTDLGDRTPSGFLRVRHGDTLRSECDDLGLQIVTHQKEFVPLELLGGMNGQFCRRQREDQPPVTGVHCRKSEYVPAEGAISRCILAVEDYVRAKNHERSFFWLENRPDAIFSHIAEYLSTRCTVGPARPTHVKAVFRVLRLWSFRRPEAQIRSRQDVQQSTTRRRRA